ncbi:MAG: mandelate racemase/muconate lactonizing enzyme family protein [Planctomycetota bacterium]
MKDSHRQPASAHVVDSTSYLLPVRMRMPLKFGSESVEHVVCLRVRVTLQSDDGRTAVGWGETPLSVTWAWPDPKLSYADRYDAMVAFADSLQTHLVDRPARGHAIEIGHDMTEHLLPTLRAASAPAVSTPAVSAPAVSTPAASVTGGVPELASLVIGSAYDLAVHDAYGKLHDLDTYQTYTSEFLKPKLATFFENPETFESQGTSPHGVTSDVSFQGSAIQDFLVSPQPTRMPVWHLVGGLDPLDSSDAASLDAPEDDYPFTLEQWMRRDGLTHLKIKLRGTDTDWDYERILRVAEIADACGGAMLSTDFNCTVTDPQYVNDILDRLEADHPKVFGSIRYVEQPFPHDLPANRIDVHSVSRRKDLFLDESAHNWRFVRLGRRLGWTGVALKTCKTQTGALLSLCWAKAHGMPLMVQDLTNPMLAQIPHCRLAAAAGTIAGVESNGMQFYPDASLPEAEVHPGLYQRRDGKLDLSTLTGPGFGYRIDEIQRTLPPAHSSASRKSSIPAK